MVVFSRVFGLTLVLPTFRSHYSDVYQVAPIWIGVALGAHGLTMALMQWPVGVLSDRWGRKRLLVATSLVFVAGCVACALASSLPMLIAGRLLQMPEQTDCPPSVAG